MPKGVAIEHRSTSARLQWSRESFSDEQISGVLASTSVCFDLSVWELFLPLSSGGTVVLAQNALQLPELVGREQVTLVNTVPSAMTELLRSGDLPRSVKVVNLCGEQLKGSLVKGVYDQGSIETVFNLYGPSEDTTYSTYVQIDRDDEGEPSIGRPLGGTRAYVLDQWGQQVPIGVSGELYLGGVGLARGYLGREQLTAERFVEGLIEGEARVYRTGDVVRYRQDGELEFVGRVDHQVKLRGYRIELGEIAARAAQYKGVQESVAMVRGGSGREQIVLYVVSSDAEVVDESGLKLWLRQSMPAYMVPTAYVWLEQLPMTPNGKIDRAALPENEQSVGAAEYVAPNSELEHALVEIIADVLKREKVGMQDNFFELGGHSLLVVQVASRIREQLNLTLPMKSFFEYPVIGDLAEQLEHAGSAVEEDSTLCRIDGREAVVSYAQQRLWVLDRLMPGGSAYNVTGAVELQGPLNVDALQRALQHIVDRHETLRSYFVEEDGVVRPMIEPSLAIELERHSFTGRTEQESEAELREWMRSLACHAFDLSSLPLLRVLLLRRTEQTHVLAVCMHHIASDGWSVGVFVRELGMLYEAFSRGLDSPLDPLKVHYSDYAHWHKQRLDEGQLDADRDYWVEHLQGAPQLIELPLDRARRVQPRLRGASLSIEFEANTVEKLNQIGRKHGTTLFMTLLSAYAVVLHRYGGGDDLVIGTPVANRTRIELEPLIGFFVNTLALRVDLSGEPTLSSVLERVRRVTLDGFVHQDLPFDRLVKELNPGRSLNHAPLFQVMFLLQNAPAEALSLSQLTLKAVESETVAAKFDLTLVFKEDADGRLSGELAYDSDLFEPSTIGRILDSYKQVIDALIEDEAQAIAHIEVIDEKQKQQLSLWRGDERSYEQVSVLELLARQVRATPEAVALVCESAEQLSYAQLWTRSQALGEHLRAQGVVRETLVGVCMERSSALVVGLLAVWSAGGAYVPIDPKYPVERRRFMLEDSGAQVVLVDASTVAEVERELPAGVVVVQAEEHIVEQENIEADIDNIVAQVSDLAYVIYTSGSTGVPKGVAIEHRSTSARLQWSRESFSDEQISGVLASTSVCFDLSIYELFVPLSRGGTVVLAQNALQLPELVGREQVTLVNTVPSAMTELLRSGGLPRSVKVVNLAGEPLKGSLVKGLYDQDSIEAVFNLYGPSEDTTYSTYVQVDRDSESEPSIGRPLGGTRAYVLDQLGQPVPIGVSGELYLGGVGLARGYLGREQLTAERFVEGVVAGEARVYRTGDVVRYRQDGELEFVGRADHQVKVRGYRIELGEIEALADQYNGVQEAVAMVRGGSGREQIVLYVVSSDAEAVDEAGLKLWLRQSMPAYMVPTAYVWLEQLPMTPNGKIDRAALPENEMETAVSGAAYMAPVTETEQTVASILSSVLGRERIGINDGFFELGGDSLMLLRVHEKLCEHYPGKLKIVDLFRFTTVSELAVYLSSEAAVDEEIVAQAKGRADSRKQALQRRKRNKKNKKKETTD